MRIEPGNAIVVRTTWLNMPTGYTVTFEDIQDVPKAFNERIMCVADDQDLMPRKEIKIYQL